VKYQLSTLVQTQEVRETISDGSGIFALFFEIFLPKCFLEMCGENTILGELSVRNSLQIRNYISDLEITKKIVTCVTIYYFNIEILKMAEKIKYWHLNQRN